MMGNDSKVEFSSANRKKCMTDLTSLSSLFFIVLDAFIGSIFFRFGRVVVMNDDDTFFHIIDFKAERY